MILSNSTKTSSSPAGTESHPWRKLFWAVPTAIAALALLVFAARWARDLPGVEEFILRYPGESHLPAGAPEGLPWWLRWQHFFNFFLLVLIIRSGWLVRTNQRPSAYWTRNNKGLLRTKNPPKKISLDLWFHQSLDVLWLLNGVVFIIVLVVTGHWVRIVPTSWDIFPNALSAAVQYVSLDWPTENGWVNYNALQVLAYFTVVFIASPLAAATGVRMSGAWPANAKKVNKAYPIEVARAIHFPVMLFFVLFIIVHVTLVFATGALRNLNHMYAGQDVENWAGFWIFAGSLALVVGACLAARPLILRPIASLLGKVSR